MIEDDKDLLEMAEAFFRPKGYQVVVYEDSNLALKDLEKKKVQCDVIVTDLNMPNLTGIEFTKACKDSGIATPIIIMTANKSIETALEAIQAGAYDFVVKPLNFIQLLVAIERALYLNKVEGENNTLKDAVKIIEGTHFDGIIGKSEGFRKAIDLAKRVANSTANVLIMGESGTGKDVIARMIHNLGDRKKAPYVAINCSAIPENLLESELFGHAKGAFTGASDKKIGLFEEAEGGTLFLDEIGDLSLPLQAKLLRVLQERKIKRIGENQFRPVNVRVISATHKNLKSEIGEKRFREDLFFRLNVIPIQIPPLRERKEDIIPLAEFFLRKFKALNNSQVKGFSKLALDRVLTNPWRGNVRELENAIERAVVLCVTDYIQAEDLPDNDQASNDFSARVPTEKRATFDDGRIMKLDDIVKQYVKYALKVNNGVKDKTAKDLGIDRKTLYRKLEEGFAETM
ncbi:MAG: sigma-54 dependent transcriptional regulator [Bdellovibrionota bacterium]